MFFLFLSQSSPLYQCWDSTGPLHMVSDPSGWGSGSRRSPPGLSLRSARPPPSDHHEEQPETKKKKKLLSSKINENCDLKSMLCSPPAGEPLFCDGKKNPQKNSNLWHTLLQGQPQIQTQITEQWIFLHTNRWYKHTSHGFLKMPPVMQDCPEGSETS